MQFIGTKRYSEVMGNKLLYEWEYVIGPDHRQMIQVLKQTEHSLPWIQYLLSSMHTRSQWSIFHRRNNTYDPYIQIPFRHNIFEPNFHVLKNECCLQTPEELKKKFYSVQEGVDLVDFSNDVVLAMHAYRFVITR